MELKTPLTDTPVQVACCPSLNDVADEIFGCRVAFEPTVADYIAAEVDAPVYRQYAFKVALISRLIEKLEGFDGEVTMGMMKELKPVDVARLSDALTQLEEGDEGEE